MKLSIQDLGRTGKAAGNIYAISAVGSVVGTFLPVLVLTNRFAACAIPSCASARS